MSRLAESLFNQGLIGNDERKIADPAEYNDGAGGTFVDADTIDRDGERYRLTGYDAREVDKFRKGNFQSGELGGREQTLAVSELARRYGYNNLVETGEVDPFGRKLADLQDANGRSFSKQLRDTGIVKPDQYTTQKDQQESTFAQLAQRVRKATGNETDWDNAAAWIDEAIAEQTQYEPQFKRRAGSEQELAEIRAYDAEHGTQHANQYTTATTQIRHKDRDIYNNAKNPLSVSWDIGVKGAVEGLTGTLELIGHETGWEGLENWAEGQLVSQRADLANMPKVLTDYKNIEGMGDFFQYVGNMAAISLPYMAVTVGGAALGGVGLTAPAAVYAGQVWNEMGDTDETEKNAATAIAAGIGMATLDRLGIAGLGNASLLSRGGRKKVLDKMMESGQYANRAAAEATLVKASRLEAAKFAGDAKGFAADMLDKQNILRATLANTLQNATTEGATEIAQETLGYLAAVAGSDGMEYNPAELLERIEHAAVGGFALGGAFSVPASVYDVGAWTDVKHRLAPADSAQQSKQARRREKEIAEYGRVRSITDLQQEAADNAARRGPSVDLTARAKAAREDKKTISETAREGFEAIPGLWRGITRYIFDDQVQDASPAARMLADMFGGNLEQTFSGANYESSKHLLQSQYRNMLTTPRETLAGFGFTQGNLKKNEAKVSSLIYNAFDIARNDDGSVDWDKLENTQYQQYIPALKQFAQRTQAMTDKIYLDQKAAGADIRKLDNYGFRVRSVDKIKVEADEAGFKQDLMDQFDLGEAEAQTLVDALVGQNDINDLSDAFSLLEKGGLKPSAHKERTLNMSDNKEFADKWLSNNIFYNLNNASKSAARFKSYQDFVGQDNAKVNELFQQMEDELVASGMDPADAKRLVNKKARLFQDYLDAESGNYKQPTTTLGRNLQRLQKQVMMLTTVAGLPLATLSSFVEFGLVHKSLEPKHIAGLSNYAKEFTEAFWKDINRVADNTPARKALRDTGFFDWEVGAATLTGATQQTNKNAERLEIFFKAIGLTQWTDYTRALRASFAMDYINDKMELIEASNRGDVVTNEQAEAREALANIGININDFLPVWGRMREGMPLDEAEEALATETIRTATFNWVNDAIVLPQSAARPLFYQNPNLALFTQFHGFISTFTANQLPKLYKQAFKGKTPAMKYNAFAIMTTMIMLGFMSQYLKDLLKYGKTTPYLDTAEKVQRGIGATGLLGTGERVLNLFNPIYEKQYDTAIGKVFGEIAGESAAITNTLRAGEAAGELVGGDLEQAARKGGKLLPIIGPFTAIQDKAREQIF